VAHTHHANHALPVYVFTRPTYTRKLTGLSEVCALLLGLVFLLPETTMRLGTWA
jgi:hypothetical protein